MNELQIGAVLGGATAALGVGALRFPGLAWGALAPLGWALFSLPPLPAGVAGGLAGAVLVGFSLGTATLLPLMVLGGVVSAVWWGVWAAALAALWPSGSLWPALACLPAFAVGAVLPLRLVGAPRWSTNPLARTQEKWLRVVHIARLGSDLWVTFALAVAATALLGLAFVLALGFSLEASLVLGLCLGLVAALLTYGEGSYRRAVRLVDSVPRVRVAAVVCDGAPPSDLLNGFWPLQSPEYADVEATRARYAAHLAAAVEAGAQLVVLPEVAMRVDETTRGRWIACVADWAKEHRITIVAPYFDAACPSNELVAVGPDGQVVSRYEKQHPSPLEAKCRQRMAPARTVVPAALPLTVSSVICVDLDYGDLVRSVAQAGGILAVPANDWRNFEQLHHQTAVWAAVLCGVSVLRATGHGISSAYDGAGRVLCQQSSFLGPVVLLADLPVAAAAA